MAVWASRGNRALQRDSHRGLAHCGFRDAAKVSVEHRFSFSADATVRLVSSTMLYGTLGWMGMCALGLRDRGEFGGPVACVGLIFALIVGVVTVPLAAYIALQSRRPVVVTRGEITARHWTGWTRRLRPHDDVRLVMRQVDLKAYAIEAFSAGRSLHLVRVDEHEVLAIESQLREAIAETSGVVLAQELVPLSRAHT